MGTIRFNIVILLMLFSEEIVCSNYSDVYRLQNDLLQNYSITIRPVLNQSSAVNVNVAYVIKALNDFDVVQGRLTLVGVFFLAWIDENIKWNPSSYGNVTSIELSNTIVWTPDVLIVNGVDSVKVTNGHFSDVRYTKDGIASFGISGVIALTCNPYIKFYPYDMHTCPVEIGVMTSVQLMTLTASNSTIFPPNVESNTMWTFSYAGVDKMVEANTPSVQFILILERRPAYLMLVLVIPVCLLYVFNLFVFMLPAETGERLSFGMTILLTLSVYMTIMSDNIPNTSDPVSLLSVSLLMKLIVSGLMSVANVLILIVYNQPEEKPIPVFFKRLFVNVNTRKIHVDANGIVTGKPVNKMADDCPGSESEIGKTIIKLSETESGTVMDNQYSKCMISWGSVGKKLDVISLAFFTCTCVFEIMITLIVIIWRLE